MKREDIFIFLNNIIEEEHGNKLNEDQVLIESELDSFGYAILWTSTDYTLGVRFTEEESRMVDHKVLTFGEMISMIESKIKEKEKKDKKTLKSKKSKKAD